MNRYAKETEPDDRDHLATNVKHLTQTVVGHRIVSVERVQDEYRFATTFLTLDDGRKVEIADSSDCCAYAEVRAFLLHPEMVEHVITGVGTTDGLTSWHIYASMGDVLNLTVEFGVGSGYYSYGFNICVVELDGERRELDRWSDYSDAKIEAK